MAFESEALMRYRVPEARQTLSARDCILYGLSVGAGSDPGDARQLRFVYERDLRALPMMANVLAHPGFWVREPGAGIDWRKVVHGEQSLTLHRRLPTHGELVGKTRITAIVDKGAARGAFVYSQRDVVDAASGEPLCTLTQTNVCRGDGGCGSQGTPPEPQPAAPRGAPDLVIETAIAPHAALLYRLNGDTNPLHADPEAARAVGFERPLLHGLCTFGMAGLGILGECCDYDESRVRHMRVRFTAPVFPGETLRTEVWRDAGLWFRTHVVERGVVALDNGRIEFGEAQP